LNSRPNEAHLEDQKAKKNLKGHLEEEKTAKPTKGMKNGKTKGRVRKSSK
jgi:hypothetical protein